MDNSKPECQNCGMIDVSLIKDHCFGCTCQCCGKTAEEAGGSINDMGWCDNCEQKLQNEPALGSELYLTS